MAGNKINTGIGVTVTTKGAAQANEELSKLGTTVKVTGSNATGAARGFGDMQKGLGGFVGAYAGAAATFFALQQAYSALKESAKMEQSVEGTKLLASEIGESGSKLLDTIKNITKGQLTLKDAAEATNLALSSGFNGDQIEKLTSIATKASLALGRDLGDSFIRLVRGSAKLEPELLDELGIFTRIDPAVQAYAITMGKSEKFLTNFERRQAFVNAVTEEGSRKFANIAATGESTASSIERLAASLYDLGQKMTAVLATTFAPVADFLSGSLANSFSAIGLLGAVAFGKLFQVITVGLDNANKKLVTMNDNTQRWVRNVFNTNKPEDLAKIAEETSKFKGGPRGLSLIQDSEERTKTFAAITGKNAEFKASDINKLREQVIKERAAGLNQIQEALKGKSVNFVPDVSALVGITNTPAVRANAKAGIQGKAAGTEIEDAIKEQIKKAGIKIVPKGTGADEINKSQQTAIIDATKSMLNVQGIGAAISTLDSKQNLVTKGLEKTILGFKSAASSIISAIDMISKGFSRLIFIVSAIQLAFAVVTELFGGSDAFDVFYKKVLDIGASFFGMTKAAQELKKTMSSLASLTIGEQFKKVNIDPIEKLPFIQSIAGIKYETQKDQGDFSKEASVALQSAYTAAQKPQKPTWAQDLVKWAQRTDKNNGMGYSDETFKSLFGDVTATPEDNFKDKLQETIDAVKKTVPASFEAATANQAFIVSLEELQQTGLAVVQVMAQLSASAGITASAFKNADMGKKFSLNEAGTATTFKYDDNTSLDILTSKGMQDWDKKEKERIEKLFTRSEKYGKAVNGDDKVRQVLDVGAATRATNEGVKNRTLTQESSLGVVALETKRRETEKYLSTQVINPDGLAKQEVAIQTQIEKIEKMQAEIRKNSENSPLPAFFQTMYDMADKVLQKERESVDLLKERINRVQNLLQLETQLAKTFQSEINLAQEFSGSVNEKGELATQSYELKANLLTNLSKRLRTGNNAVDMTNMSSAEKREAVANQNIGEEGILRRLNSTSLNIIKGLRISVAQEIENLGNATIKSTTQSQLELVTAIAGVTKQKNANEIAASEQMVRNAQVELDMKTQVLEMSLRNREVANSISQLSTRNTISNLEASKSTYNLRQELSQGSDNPIPTSAISDNYSTVNQKIEIENSAAIEKQRTLDNYQVAENIKNLNQQVKLLEMEKTEANRQAELRKESLELEKNLLMQKVEADLQVRMMEFDILDKRVAILVQEGQMLAEFAKVIGLSVARDRAQAEMALPSEERSDEAKKALAGLTKTNSAGKVIQDVRYESQIKALTELYKGNIVSGLEKLGPKVTQIQQDTMDNRSRAQLSAEKQKEAIMAMNESQVAQLTSSNELGNLQRQSSLQKIIQDAEGKNLAKKQKAMEAQAEISNRIKDLAAIEETLTAKIRDLRYEIRSNSIEFAKIQSTAIINESENNIKVMQASLDHENAMRDIAIARAQLESRGAQAAIQGQIDRLNTAKELLDVTGQIATQRDRIADFMREASDLQKNNKTQFSLDLSGDVGSNLFSDPQKRQLKLELDISKLDTLRETTDRAIAANNRNAEDRLKTLDIEREIAKKNYELASAQAGAEDKRIELEKEKIVAQNALLDRELGEKKKIFEQQMEQAKRDNELQLQRIEQDKLNRDLEIAATRDRVELITREINGFADVTANFISDLAYVLASHTAKLMMMSPDQIPEAMQAAQNEAELTDWIKQHYTEGLPKEGERKRFENKDLMDSIGRYKNKSDENFAGKQALETAKYDESRKVVERDYEAYQLSVTRAKERNAGLLANLELEKKVAGAAAANAYQTYQDTLRNIDKKKELSEVERQAAELDLGNKLKSYELEVERSKKLNELSKDAMFLFANDFVGIVKNDMTKGLQDLNSAIVDGSLTWANFTEGLRDWTLSFLKNTQEALIQRALIDPITNYVQEQMGSLVKEIFDIDIEKPKIEGALVQANGGLALRITSADPNAANTAGLASGLGGATGITAGNALSIEEIKTQSAALPGGWMPGFETLSPEERATVTEAGGAWAQQSDAMQTVNDKAQDSANIFTNLGSKMGDWSIAITGSLASVLAAGGDFSKALPGIFASVFAQILKDAASSAAGGSGSGSTGGLGGMIGGLFGNLFGGGGGEAAASGGVEAAWSGLSAGWGFSSGGPIKRMASGGEAGRDTVHTMLEPGEYVLRKSAVESLGLHTVNRMNNLGKAAVKNKLDDNTMTMGGPVLKMASGGSVGGGSPTGSGSWLTDSDYIARRSSPTMAPAMPAAPAQSTAAPQVAVNVQSQGTPQDVQGKPEVKFDGQKMVIDIVLKDFRNNGPIRQTLRGNTF